MKLLEEFILGKAGRQELCEDFMVFTPGFAAVIDGVTSKDPRYAGNGRIAAELLSQKIRTLPANVSLSDCLEMLSGTIYDYYRSENLLEEMEANPRMRCGASAIIYSAFRKEIWLIGDCQCLVNGKFYDNPTGIDRIMSEARSLFNFLELRRGTTYNQLLDNDPGREFIGPMLQSQSLLQNNPQGGEYTFLVIDGFPLIESMVKTIPVKSGDEIVLASDGYPRLCRTLEESEACLSGIIENDPLLIFEFKSTKGVQKGNLTYDDRAYLKFIC